MPAGTTTAEGVFEFTLPQLTEVLIDIDNPGFHRWRTTLTPTPNQVDFLDVEVDVERLPAPQAQLDLDRFGVFLPGVTKSGDSQGFDPDNARGALTMTWTVDAAAMNIPLRWDNFPFERQARPDSLEDEVTEVFVFDPRFFTEDDVQELDLPRHYLEAVRIQRIAQNRGSGFGPAGEIPYSRGVLGENGMWTGTFLLSDLPAGAFEPVAVVLTRAGATAVVPFAFEEGRELRGYGLPPWMATLLNAVGSAGNYQVSDFFPDGALIPSGFTGAIDVNPRGFLTYDYFIDVTVFEGQETPTQGLLGLAPENLGPTVGARLRLTVDGEAGDSVMSGAGTLSQDFVEEGGFALPAIAKGRVPVTLAGLTLSGSTEISLVNHISVDGAPLGQFSLRRTTGADISGRVEFNIVPVLNLIPGVGPAIAAVLGYVDLRVGAYVDFLVGGDVIVRMETLPPTVGGTDGMAIQPVRSHFLAGEEFRPDVVEDVDFAVRLALGAGLYGGLGARLRVEGGIAFTSPADREIRGARITLGNERWPFISRVEAAVSAQAAVRLRLGLEVEREFQVDLVRVDQQYGTEPVFTLTPTGERSEIITPDSAPPTVFVGRGGRLVDQVYGAGVFGRGPDGGLLYTAAESGGLRLMYAAPEPALIAEVPGVVGGAVGRVDGDLVAVWGEITELGDPTAHAVVRYATSSDGVTWSDAVMLGELEGLPYDFGFDGDAVTWVLPRGWAFGSDRVGQRADLSGAVETVQTDAPVRRAAGPAFLTDAGQVVIGGQVVADGAASLGRAGDGVVVGGLDGTISVHADGEVTLVAEGARTAEIAASAVPDGLVAAWTDPSDGGLWYAFDGDEPQRALGFQGAEGLTMTSDGAAATVTFQVDGGPGDYLVEVRLRRGQPPVLPDGFEEPGNNGAPNNGAPNNGNNGPNNGNNGPNNGNNGSNNGNNGGNNGTGPDGGDSSGGCGCRVGGVAPGGYVHGLWFVVLALVWRSRR